MLLRQSRQMFRRLRARAHVIQQVQQQRISGMSGTQLAGMGAAGLLAAGAGVAGGVALHRKIATPPPVAAVQSTLRKMLARKKELDPPGFAKESIALDLVFAMKLPENVRELTEKQIEAQVQHAVSKLPRGLRLLEPNAETGEYGRVAEMLIVREAQLPEGKSPADIAELLHGDFGGKEQGLLDVRTLRQVRRGGRGVSVMEDVVRLLEDDMRTGGKLLRWVRRDAVSPDLLVHPVDDMIVRDDTGKQVGKGADATLEILDELKKGAEIEEGADLEGETGRKDEASWIEAMLFLTAAIQLVQAWKSGFWVVFK